MPLPLHKTKMGLSYGEVLGCIRCKLNFALIRSAIMYILSAHSPMHSPMCDSPIDAQIAEAYM